MKRAIRFFAWLIAAALLGAQPCGGLADTLTVNADQAVHPVSDTLYGIFLEDINCAVDGGLNPELIKNRSFENESIFNPQRADHWDGWSVRKWDKARVTLENEGPIHENNPTFLRVDMEAEGFAVVRNQGFGGNTLRGGIPLQAGARYDFSLWLRADETAVQSGSVTAALTDIGGGSLAGEEITLPISGLPAGEWTRFAFTLEAEKTAGAVLTLSFSGPGVVDADMASLMNADRLGKDWPGGGVRRDLAEALRKLHPRFLRFPGGCVAEGTCVRSNAYEWKNTVGPVEARRETGNTWGGTQSMGLGFFEYFCLAEEIGALPVPVVHAGLLCQARDVKDPPLTRAQTEAYAQDVLDLIEFALGETSTQWGGLRAEMGHPKPFDLRFIAIGNENWGEAYFTRYDIIRRAVKEKYPEMTCIVSAGPVAEGGLIQDSWNNIRRRFRNDLVDEHYYMDSAWFPAHVNRYDTYPRTTRVFLGEYAAHEPTQGSRRPNNLHAALCEAAYLTGIERNSDVVVMSCYAPLLCREDQVDWTPDLIWFNDENVVLTPSWWVQKMFSDALGDTLVESACDGDLFQAATRTDGALQVKIVNLSAESVPLSLVLSGVPDQEAAGQLLSGDPKAVNSFPKPDKIVPEAVTVSVQNGAAETELPPCSLTILVFDLTAP